MKRLFNDGWEFSLDGGAFAPVALPHDWLIGDVHNLYKSGVGRYRRALEPGLWEDGQRVFLHFDGVYMDSALFVNGEKAGEWKYGYTAFEFDITGYLKHDGTDAVLLEVNYRSPNSRWYSGAGIFRDVTLKVKNPCHFLSDSIRITPRKQDGRWSYSVRTEAETGGRPHEVRHTLLGDGPPEDWDIDNPRLYTLRSELLVDGAVTDTEETVFGCRETRFDPNEGFFLNGRHVKLNGVCIHHDLGALGAAADKDGYRRQLTKLRGMGVNAIRTSHNPPAKVFMELCDEMGFLVMSELLDMWELPKTEFDYARFFNEWVERDAASWIRRDRNSPSVVLWSVGNEIYDTHASAERGGELLRYLMSLVKAHDPDGHAPVTLCSNYMPWENTQKCADIVKLIGYNYAERYYEKHHGEHPDWLIYGGETCSTVQSRGVYRFPLKRPILSDDDLQCSSLGNSSTSWGAESVEACVLADPPYSIGQFVWSGQDYIGEPTPYHTKNSYFGQIDTAGFYKDSAYVFKAGWTDAPTIRLFPYWDHSPGQLVDVRASTNCPRVTLFLNGESLGTAELNGRLIADWQVPFRPGELKVVGCDSDGRPVAEAVQKTFGDCVGLTLETETYGTLAYVTVTGVDADGNTVANARNRVTVRVVNGTLLGLDNGDSTDYDQYRTDSRRLFNGKLLAIVRTAGGDPGVTAELDETDVPVRKIELRADGFRYTAKVYPINATYADLTWRLTDAGGIDSPLGELIVSGAAATLRPKGDGEVWIRCMCNNGGSHPSVISQISRELTGCGTPFLNPYAFVSGGLSDVGNAALTNGNERGVVSARDGESHIGFSNLDFGNYGSDELTVPLFPLSDDPFTFSVWEGMPDEGGEKLVDVLYDKGQIWNTYQDVAVKLPKRLRGAGVTVCFVFTRKVHLKGFQFANPAYRILDAAASSGVSGDAFTANGTEITGIGNNVTMRFDNLRFTGGGARAVTVSTRSGQAENSCLLIFRDSLSERREMLKIPGSAAYGEFTHTFSEPVKGDIDLSLVFLPGSKLDLAWLQFKR